MKDSLFLLIIGLATVTFGAATNNLEISSAGLVIAALGIVSKQIEELGEKIE